MALVSWSAGCLIISVFFAGSFILYLRKSYIPEFFRLFHLYLKNYFKDITNILFMILKEVITGFILRNLRHSFKLKKVKKSNFTEEQNYKYSYFDVFLTCIIV